MALLTAAGLVMGMLAGWSAMKVLSKPPRPQVERISEAKPAQAHHSAKETPRLVARMLSGDSIAYFGDHVELSTGGEDFASTFGVGGVVGTNFAWRDAPGKKDKKLLLTPAREEKWGFWVRLYQEKRLSQGEYLGGLYDIGFDKPETHAIEKDGHFYYAFYARQFNGPVTLRGLDPRGYRVRDYFAGRELGELAPGSNRLRVAFEQFMLVEAIPL